ncbi:MAG TPA: DUF5694 domain-containing protein [Nocardioides sp.]|uniref:DUF5694 domain-containing protein n=1 Tax=Nocardioides sp. TaxID=35761 RepID=UPI002E36B42D|nr:DUF5694 domain-containing protein [Nocardioides sp.]HEX3932937.1 DUF5694 domain-containing protein [Nocardioides sp.]
MFRATRLLIVGATHLGRGEHREPDKALAGIVDRFCGWRPDAIAIEALPGELIDSCLRLGGPFADMRVGGVPQAAACAEAVRDLHSWDLWEARRIGQDRTRERAERVVAWCAAFEPYTALLLARRARALPATVREALDAVEAGGGEISRVAAQAAARLGIERLHPFDDHGNGAAMNDFAEEDFDEFILALHAKARDHPLVAGEAAEVRRSMERRDLWTLWRDRSSPSMVSASNELESGFFLTHGQPDELARAALAGWRARNLLMAGRLRSITGGYPGGRVLALVGHAHKGPLEEALATDQWDLDIVDVSELDRLRST